MNNDEKNIIRRFCFKLGKDRLHVQGAGGNFSFKKGNFLFVKASGMRLKDAISKDIFVKVNLKLIKQKLIRKKFNLNLDKFKELKTGKKPSIETAFHAIIPKKYVLHLHSINPLSHLVKTNAREIIDKKISKNINFKFIDYYKPGTRLAIEINKYINDNYQIYFLKNHGIIIAADDLKELNQLLLDITKLLEVQPRKLSKFDNIDKHKNIVVRENLLLKMTTIKEINLLSRSKFLHSLIEKYWALYPDHVVFLGPKPIIFDNIRELKRRILNTKKLNSFKNTPLFVKEKGTFYLGIMSQAQKEQLICYYDILVRIRRNSNLSTLSKKSINEIINWDQEKYRISLNQTFA